MPMFQINLTAELREKLLDVLNDTTDCGPQDEGWSSVELQQLRALVAAAEECSKAEIGKYEADAQWFADHLAISSRSNGDRA